MKQIDLFRPFFAGVLIMASVIIAHAQLYVANSPPGAISEYDAETGVLTKDSLVIGLGQTRALVYDNGVFTPSTNTVELLRNMTHEPEEKLPHNW